MASTSHPHAPPVQSLSIAGSEGETFAPEPNSSRPSAATLKKERPRPPAVVHMVAGGLGGMCGAIVTAPFDLVKTRLQSNLFAHQAAGQAVAARTGLRGLLWNFADTGLILRDVYKYEGPTALFKGLGPTLVGVIPSRSINFFVYGNGKRLIADTFNGGKENAMVHVFASAIAGVCTAAASNPIWVVKTQLQLLQQSKTSSSPTPRSRPPIPTLPHQSSFSHSFRSISSPTPALYRKPTAYSTTINIYRTQGIPGFYKGLSASLLGVTEGVIQWSLYEQFKILAKRGMPEGEEGGWRMSLAAGSAKLVATFITYPHEVIRTRLRQPVPAGQSPKYTGLFQSFRVVLLEEGPKALYGGLSPHLMRVVPNAVTMFFCYETILKWSENFYSQRVATKLVRAD